jgi:two-component system CheB/CheR fusion protein
MTQTCCCTHAACFQVAREGLRTALRNALRKVKTSKSGVHSPQVRVKTNEGHSLVNLNVKPVSRHGEAAMESTLYLVVMEIAEVPRTPAAALLADQLQQSEAPDQEKLIASLFQEIRTKDELLQSMQEDIALSNEALLSSYAEMQAAKEDLQASHEELETSKEELQSSNEELVTINAALQARLDTLSRSQGDLDKLLTTSGMGFILVDPELRIRRFTPTARNVIHLLPADIGRPVAHLVSNLSGYDDLLSDVRQVLQTRENKVLDVQTIQGNWYTMRIQPYHTPRHKIEGAVISFVEIAERKRRQQALHSY